MCCSTLPGYKKKITSINICMSMPSYNELLFPPSLNCSNTTFKSSVQDRCADLAVKYLDQVKSLHSKATPQTVYFNFVRWGNIISFSAKLPGNYVVLTYVVPKIT